MRLWYSLCCLLFLTPPCLAVDVVVHSSVNETQLTTAQLRAIFSMRQTRWADGQTIQVLVLSSETSEHNLFTRNYLKMFPYQLDAIWHRQRFSGIGGTPVQYATVQELQAALERTPGAIGYLPQGSHSVELKVVTLYEK
jgi:ABC-type phosphate transport system substrate-binding protein